MKDFLFIRSCLLKIMTISKIFGLYLALICEDNMTQGYEPFNPDTAIDNKLLSAVSSVLVSYYEQLINDCDTTIADIVSN